ncbi:MFS transporter [Leifsonia shinshuensis]|uniref:MFS family permease n=1 Tax=Leifsonia shinshuensis TaxID=150026 RepID=A0A853CRW5_9MICO|nr:MFS family permease [Leifsonia shinshuensis]
MTRESPFLEQPDPPRLWRRDFTVLWWSEALSLFGSQLTLFAIPIVALEMLDASASEVALISTAAGIGTTAMLVFFAPFTDRARRTRLMSLMSALRALCLGLLVVLTLGGGLSLPALVVVAFLVAGFTALYDSALSALVPTITHRDNLSAANTWISGIRSAGDIGAGAAAGLLLQLLSPVALFAADALTYVVSAFGVGGLAEPRQGRPARLSVRSFSQELASGLVLLVRDRTLWPITLSIAHFNLFTTAIQAIYVTHALRSGAMSPSEIGLGGVIGLLSMSVAPVLWDRFRPVALLAATFALPALSGIGMLLLSSDAGLWNVAALGASLGFWAACVMVNLTGTETLKQLLVPNDVLGRISAASRLVTWGIDPIGAAVAAVLTLFLPTGAVLIVAAVGVATSSVWILASRRVRGLPNLPAIASTP